MTDNAYHYLGLTFAQQTAYKERIRERDNYICQICGKPGYDVDHIIPFYLSHDSTEANLRVLCHPCNLINRRKTLPSGKHSQIPDADYGAYLRAELAKYG